MPLFHRKSSSRERYNPSRKRFCIPALEQLEERWLPAEFIWTGASWIGPAWSSGGNWKLISASEGRRDFPSTKYDVAIFPSSLPPGAGTVAELDKNALNEEDFWLNLGSLIFKSNSPLTLNLENHAIRVYGTHDYIAFGQHGGVIEGGKDLGGNNIDIKDGNDNIWDGGTWKGVTVTVTSPQTEGTKLTIKNRSGSIPLLDAGSFLFTEAAGALAVTGGSVELNNATLKVEGDIHNLGTFTVLGDSKLDIGSKPTGKVAIHKDSTFIRDGGGTLYVNVPFTVYKPKEFTVKYGTILLQGGGSFEDTVVDIKKDMALIFVRNKYPKPDAAPGKGEYSWVGSNEFKGDGEVTVAGGKIKIDGFTSIDTLVFQGDLQPFVWTGQIFGNGTVDVRKGLLWDDDSMLSDGATMVTEKTCKAVIYHGRLRDADFVPFGFTLDLGLIKLDPSTITNYGEFDIGTNGQIEADLGSMFENLGVVKKAGGGQSNIGVAFLNGGRGAFDGDVLTAQLIAAGGLINFTRSFTQVAGTVELAGGNIEDIGSPFTVAGGAVVGNGTIYATVVNSGGQIDPGGIGAIGTINIAAAPGSALFTGDYIGSGGVINIEFSSTGADRLNVAGQVTFGALAESFLNSYAPTSGSYTVVTYSSHTGQVFGSLEAGWSAGGATYYFVPQYMTSLADDTALTLFVQTLQEGSPAVTSVNPNSGSSSGGAVVTLQGQRFAQTISVAGAAKWFMNSDSTLTVVMAPKGQIRPLTVWNLTGPAWAQESYVDAPVPVVSGVTPSSDPVDGVPNIVAITGSNFLGASAVNFGASGAFFKIVSDSSIIAQAPAFTLAGTYDITVTTPSGTSAIGAADRFTYTVPPAPTVMAVNASSGSTSGTTVVTITGTNFSTAYDVSFGGYSANFTINSNTTITATAPAQPAGPVDVVVTTSEGSSTLVVGDRFNYTAAAAPTVTTVSPTSGSSSGGTAVNITGTNFSGASDVFFGRIQATSFTIISPTSITATAPFQAAGTYDITVMTPSGVSAVGTADQFTYTAAPPPAITSIAPSSGSSAGGMVVTVTGSNFAGASTINFGTTPAADFTVLSDTSISVTAPPIAAGSYDITVTTPSGTSATGAADHFVVTAAPAPSVTAITPSSGSAAGGTTVSITGANFTGASAVNFGTVAATDFTLVSDTSITAIAPPQTAGTYDITVVTASGTSATGAADQFTFTAIPVPIISSISPSSGSTAGGTAVIITGSGFTTTTAVNFGPILAASFTVTSDTQIVAVTPPNAAGTWDITVTTAGGTSALGSADRFTFTAAAVPAITSVSPTSGTSAGGTVVTITGTGFTGANGVNFGSIAAASFSVVSDTSIIVTIPPQAAGTYHIIVQTPTGTSAVGTGDQFTYTAASAPTVTAVSPSTGTSAGGTLTTITGTNFTGASAVNFGAVAAAGFWVVNSTTIIAITPPQAAMTVDIRVVTPSGTSAIVTADHFVVTAAPAPSVTLVTPTSGTQSGGTTVVVIGSGFTGASAVKFGTANAASFTVNSDTSITAISPYGATASQVDITVITPSGTSATGAADKFTYNYVSGAAPAVTSIAPTTGTTAGGTVVTVSGTGFTGATVVKFGATNASTFTVISDTQLTATSPAASPGTVDITLTTPSGTSSTGTSDRFTYVAASVPAVTSRSPTSGSTAGGTSVSITGTNFTGATAVTFGTVPAASFTVNSSTSITVTSPPNAAGVVDITVTTPAGTSATSASDQFTYTAASLPTVTSLSPTSGGTGGGTSVIITGTNLTGAIAVYFNGVPATSFTINSSTQITATAPAQQAGTIDVTVQTFSGTSALSTGDRFTYSAASAPSITSISPNTGSTTGGTSVTITGTNFSGATGVFFGTVAAANFTVNSSTSITATSPSQAAATVDITVATFTGTSAVVTADHFTYTNAAAPSVTGVSPNTGSTGGGTSVTITGTAFTGATAVNFGAVAATSFTVNSDTSITVTSPPQAAGTVDITVTTPSGTSATGAADHFTYTAAPVPAITNVSPSSGTIAGGTVVTIIGSGFTGASAVNFGATAADMFSVVSDTAIVATAPAGTAGMVDITIVTPSGTSATGTADHYTFTAPAVPAVTSLSPTSGTTGGATVVTITGTGFMEATAVTFGDTAAASFTVMSDTSIKAISPAHPAGTWDILVTGPGGTSAPASGDRYTFNAASAPSVTAVSPNSGDAAGGTMVIITGSNFTGATGVFFAEVAATSFTVNSDTSIMATSPANPAGTVDITVNTYGGFSAISASDHFTYTVPAPTVTAVTPNTGSTTGGTGITITGTNFSGASVVNFGNVAASDFTVVNSTTITATSPSQAAGTIDIRVTTPGGQSAAGAADQFTYTAAPLPSVTAVNPNNGSTAGGTVVTINGSNFAGATAVNFGNTAAISFQVYWNKLSGSTYIVATAPAEAAGTVDIIITTPSGTSTTGAADHYTFNAPAAPTVTAVSPTSGSTGGGTAVTITGTNFLGATGVTFGGTPATSFSIVSSTSITAVSPAQASGTIDILITTAGGTSAAGASDTFTYNAAAVPSITSISPTSGSAKGGTGVTITGSGFIGASMVKFGTVAALGFVVNSDTKITATAPPQAAATVDITVTTPSGTSATGAVDRFTYTAVPVPTVSGVSPTSGSTNGTATIIITGTGFMGTTSVNFGSPPPPPPGPGNGPIIWGPLGFVVDSDTQIRAFAPAHSGGTIDVTVTSTSGTSSTGAADRLTYVTAPLPSVTQVTPTSVSTTGGATVTILGSGFLGASAVKFGTTAATSFTVYDDLTIVAVAPAHASGAVHITVTTPSGTSSTSAADQVTYTVPPPSITGLNPTSGSTSGGTSVTITGTAFTGTTSVKFGATNATGFTVNSDTQITATSPAGSAGMVDVTVTTAQGTSAIVYADQFTYTGMFAPMMNGGDGSPALTTVNGQATSGSTDIASSSTAVDILSPEMTFTVSGLQLTSPSKQESLWTNAFWADNLAPIARANRAASALAASLIHSAVKAPATPNTASRYWLTHDELTTDLADFLFANEPGSMAGDVLDRTTARMFVK